MMTQELKHYFKKAKEHSITVTRIAATGGSGAGKTTSTLEFMNKFGQQFIYSNIGAIQSSKIRTVVIPLNIKAEERENACLCIHFMKHPDVDLIMRESRRAIIDKMVKAYRSYEDEDAEDIVRDFLSPSNRIYNITKYCSEMLIKEFEQEIFTICTKLIEENAEQRSLIEEIKIRKANIKNKGQKFNADDVVAKEVEKRLDKISLDKLQLYVQAVADKIKACIEERINEFCAEGLDIERNEDEIIVYIDQSTGKAANELFQYMFVKDGKDLVVSHLTFMTPMSDDAIDVFYKEKPEENKMPLFKIYDLKGLETGVDSIDDTIIKIRESMPDAILAYQRTNDISAFFIKYLDSVQREFGKIPTYAILTHADTSMKSYLRNMLNSFGAKSKGQEGYEEYYQEQVRGAYERLQTENHIYVEKIREFDNSGYAVFCSLVDESEDIDRILGNDALYNPKRILELVAEICERRNSLYRKLKGIEADIVDGINITFNDGKLDKLVNDIVSGHNTHAPLKYYNQAKLYPHWNTVYKWRAMHRVGSGWSSSAKVYDNINIYIDNFISGFMNREAILNAIEIDLPENTTVEQQETMKAAIYDNVKEDMKWYNGFFYQLKLMITYKGFEDEFSGTYFSNALDLIYTKLSDFDYVKDTMKKALEMYKGMFIAETFE